jgi:hypothetical protein
MFIILLSIVKGQDTNYNNPMKCCLFLEPILRESIWCCASLNISWQKRIDKLTGRAATPPFLLCAATSFSQVKKKGIYYKYIWSFKIVSNQTFCFFIRWPTYEKGCTLNCIVISLNNKYLLFPSSAFIRFKWKKHLVIF